MIFNAASRDPDYMEEEDKEDEEEMKKAKTQP
jgi:hypothetical protein